MDNIFVPYEIAKQLREKGFTEPCLACYDGSDMLSTYSTVFKPFNYNVGGSPNKSAPLYQEVIDWLYDKGISLEIYTCNEDGKSFNHVIRKVGKKTYEIKALNNKCVADRYEAMDKGIIEALKLI